VALVEDSRPKLKELHRYVVIKHAVDWKDIGVELELNDHVLGIIEKDNGQKSDVCFKIMLKKWLESSHTATWNTLEIALTNVSRQKLGLLPVDKLYDGKFAF